MMAKSPSSRVNLGVKLSHSNHPHMKIIIISLLLILAPVAVSSKTLVNLNVPFTPETPDNVWTAPWKDACEEASIVMVSQYYLGKQNALIPKAAAKALMQKYFTIENKIFGWNANTDAAHTAKLINEHSKIFAAEIKNNPTLAEIKAEVQAGRPVIAALNALALTKINDHLRFRRNGSYYHMLVIVGYDDETNEFIVNDNGDYSGLDHRYSYDIIMDSLRDYSYKTHKANGPARALFTYRKMLAKTATSNRIYWIEKNVKQYVTHPAVFKQRGWRWANVQVVEKSVLDGLTSGTPIAPLSS